MPPFSFSESFGLKARFSQPPTWKRLERLATVAPGPRYAWPSTDDRFAVGRVEGEVRAVEVDPDVPEVERDAVRGSVAAGRRRR